RTRRAQRGLNDERMREWCVLTTIIVLFFFQAEDGIRDFHVTGVQMCALPIYGLFVDPTAATRLERIYRSFVGETLNYEELVYDRSEERRVGKEWRFQWGRAR